RMDNLISDLLQYSRLTQSELHPQILQPSEIVDEVILAMAVEARQIPLQVTVDGELPEVYGDPVLLQQVFHNLISNGLKFMKQGVPPRVRLTGEREENFVVLSVIDNGVGIPTESQGRLFRLFERLGASRDFPGTGIGLAIVRRAAERMGGDCGGESQVGVGSRFWIRLPAGNHPTTGAPSPPSPPP